jgi:hypothetical protein
MGPREGRSGSKEQYWVIYDTTKFTVLGVEPWPDGEDKFERNPLGVFFRTTGSFDFILINNHLQPAGAEAEIRALPEVIGYYQEVWNEPDVIVLGDFNADGQYYDEGLLTAVFPPPDYKIIIPNELDTTVAASDNTYDRIVITASLLEDYNDNYGVIRFDEIYDFSQYTAEPRAVSDHYPVWAEFVINRDTD